MAHHYQSVNEVLKDLLLSVMHMLQMIYLIQDDSALNGCQAGRQFDCLGLQWHLRVCLTAGF